MTITKEFSDRSRSFTLECSTDIPGMVILVHICHRPNKIHLHIYAAEKQQCDGYSLMTHIPGQELDWRGFREVPNKRFSKIVLEAFVDTVSRTVSRASDENFIDLSCPIVAGFHAVIRDLIRRKVIC